MTNTFTAHRLAASAALAIAGATSLAAGTPALAAQPLAGTTVIEASAPAMTRVTLPRDTPFNEATTLSMSGGGRAIVFVMQPAGAPPTDARRVSSIQMNFCWTAGCKPDNPLTITNALNFDSSTPGSTTLPAGDYDVYLAPDGAPAAVTLKL